MYYITKSERSTTVRTNRISNAILFQMELSDQQDILGNLEFLLLPTINRRKCLRGLPKVTSDDLFGNFEA